MIKVQTIFKLWYLFSSNKKFYLYWSNNLRNKPGKKMHLMADKDNHLINLFLEIQSSCSLILDKWLYGRSLFTPSQYLIWELEQQTFLKDATFTYERLRDFRENCCANKAMYFSCQFITKSQNLTRVSRRTVKDFRSSNLEERSNSLCMLLISQHFSSFLFGLPNIVTTPDDET